MLIAMTDYCQTLLQQIKAIDVSVIFFSSVHGVRTSIQPLGFTEHFFLLLCTEVVC